MTETFDEYKTVMNEVCEQYQSPSDLRKHACLLIKEGAPDEKVVDPFISQLISDCDGEIIFKRRMLQVGRNIGIDVILFNYPIDSNSLEVTYPNQLSSSYSSQSSPLLSSQSILAKLLPFKKLLQKT